MRERAKERPILFSGPMVRAILSGAKTQTRRLVTHRHPISFIGCKGEWDDPSAWGYSFDGPDHNGYMVIARGLDERHDHGRISLPCPYGEPGDRLWVRETWGLRAEFDFTDWFRGTLRSGDRILAETGLVLDYRADWQQPFEECFWRPSIHMPRWASRITLEVVDVRVERLQAITEADARAEGVDPGSCIAQFDVDVHRPAFAKLWDGINGARGPWSTNPWVWVVSFKRAGGAA